MSIGKSTVDERVVEMRIDNEKFEAGAKKTIGILESLDRSLKGLGQDNVDGFDNIEKSLDKVTDRFSAMGIVGDQIMRNLTNKAMELVGQFKNMATMLTTQQIGAGWDKFASKTEAVQTIMASTNNLVGEGLKWANQEEQLEGVTEQLQRLTWFADETSYSFTDMVNNVGKFTAAGRELEESVTAMQGISTWAAISGGKPAEASRAMYNLSQALGLGAVTAIDWKSIELANMATYEFKQQAIDTAVELGKLKKVGEGVWETLGGNEVTVEKFRDTLTFGKGDSKEQWFDSDVLLSVLNRYGDFAQLVAAVQEDFGYDSATYVLSDLKEYEERLKTAGEAEKFLERRSKELGISLDELKGAMDEMLAPEYDLGRRAFQAAQEAKTFTEAIDATRDAVSTKWMDVFELLFGNYLEAKELWTKLAETLWDIFARPVDHLISIIEGAGGFLGEDGLFGGFTSGAKQAAGGTAVLEDRLSAVGKTMDDFKKALYTVSDRQLIDTIENYNSVEEALSAGAISAETFKKALGALDDSYDTKKPVTLNRALNKAGKTMQDFEKALKDAMDPKDVVRALGSYESIEDAFRNGAISVDDFKEALASLGIDSENVTEEIDSNVQASIGSLEELRQFALEVLRGDHGNGDERLAWYESMGLDSELMQAMAGDLKNMGYYMSDEMLMAAMESYYQYNNLSARLGYETFAEYLASITSATGEAVYDMNQMAEEADHIYASLFGEGVLDEYGDYISAGELFRKSLTNLMEALDNFGTAFDKAFMKVFGGSDNDQEQLANMSDGFFTLTAAFYSFSESVKRFSESEAFQNFATAMFSVLRMIGKAIGLVFKIAKTGLYVIMKLLSPVLNLLSGIFNIVTTGLDAVSRSFESSGIIDFIEVLSDMLLEKIAGPVEKINYVIDRLIEAFKAGFENGGIAGGIRNVSEAIDILFQNHPVFLAVVHAFGKALIFLKDAIEGLAMVLGSVFGGAVVVLVAGFQKLGEWFGQLIDWAQSSEIMADIWTALTEAVSKFGRVIKRVFNYAKTGYEQNGVIGALSAVVDSFERGVTRLVPGGEKLVSIFNSIKSAIKDIFKKKTVDENGLVQTVDDTGNALLKLEEAADTVTNITRDAFGTEEQQAGFRDRIKQLVANAWAGFLEGLRDIRIGDVIDAMRLGVIANILLKVGHGLNIFNQLGENIKDIPETFSDMFEDLGRTFRSLSFDIKANAVLKFAVAAGLIAGAIFILSKIPEDKLEKASSVVISILAVLSLLIAVLGKTTANILNSVQYLVAFGTSLIGLAAVISSIGLTALTLALVSKFVGADHLKEATKTILKIIRVVVGLIAGLIALIKLDALNEWEIKALGSALRGMGAGLIGIALAVQMLVLPVLAFSLVLKFARGDAGIRKFNLAAAWVVRLLIAIGAMVWLASSAVNGLTEGQTSQLGTMIIKIAAGLMIIALSINMLTMPILLLSAAQKFLKLDINGMIGAVAMLGIVAAVIALILAAFGGEMAKKDAEQIRAVGNVLIKLAASMLLIAVGIGLLIKPIIKIAELCSQIHDWHIIKALMIIVGMIGVLAGVLLLLNKVVLKGKGGANSLGLGKGLFRIAEAMFLLAAAALVLTPAIILMTAAIAGFAYALGKMKPETWETFENGLKRLGTFSKYLAGFGGALLLVGLAATLTGAGVIAMSLSILVFAAAIAVIMLALPKLVDTFKKLEEIDPKKINYSVGKLAIMIGALTIGLVAFAYAVSRISHLLGGGMLRRAGEGLAKSIRDIATGVRKGFSNGFTTIITYLKDEENKKTILTILESLILVGAAYVAGILPTMAHVVIGGLVGLLNAVAAEINAQAPEIVDAITNIINAVLTIFKGLVAQLFGEESWEEMSWWQKGLTNFIVALLLIAKVASAMKLAAPFSALASVLTGAGGAAGGGLIASLAAMLPWIIGIAAAVALVAFAIDRVKKYKDALAAEEDARNEKFFGEKDPSIEARAAQLKEIQAQYDEAVAREKAFQDAMKQAQKNQDNEAYHEAESGYIAAAQEIATMETDYLTLYSQFAEDLARVTGESKKEILNQLKESGGDVNQVEAYQKYLEIVQQEAEATRDYVSELQSMKAVIDAVEDSREKASAMTAYKQALEEDAAAMGITVEELRALVEGYSTVETTATQTATAIGNAQDTVATASEGIKDNIKNAVQGAVEEQGIDINDFIKTDGTGLDTEKLLGMLNLDQFKEDLKGYGVGLGEDGLDLGMETGIDSGMQSVLDSLTGGSGDMLTLLQNYWDWHSPSGVTEQLGKDIDAGLGLGIDQNYYMAVNPLYTLMDEMSYAFASIRERFIGHGAQIVSGLIQGISDNMKYAYETGQSLATSVENGFRNKLEIQSPSRVFAQLARYIPLGIEEGISGESSSAITSVTVLGDALINAILQSMAMVSTVANDEFEFTPQITPVVDLSNVNAAASSVNGMFGRMSLGAFNKATAVQAERYAGYTPKVSNNYAFVDEMQALNSRIDDLGMAITNMQVVLDSGELVGATSAKMDARLGVLASRKGRGN